MSERKTMLSYLLSALFTAGLFSVIGSVSAHECPQAEENLDTKEMQTINGDRFEWIQGD